MKPLVFIILTMSVLSIASQLGAQNSEVAPYRVLIVDGENNHGVWPKTTAMMKDYLEQTGLFTVDVKRTRYTWQGPHYDESIGVEPITDLLSDYPLATEQVVEPVEEPKPDPDFAPDFKTYDVIISNMGWKASTWLPEVRKELEEFVRGGGGFVVIHAANNSWGDWDEFNRMIGVGGWGGRSTESGPYVYYDNDGDLVKDSSEGDCGSHGPQQEYVVTTRAPEHPIMKGLPTEWLHTKDELYDRLRGPAENITVLATAYSDVEKNGPPWNKKVKGSGRHEPMLMAIEYGKGRVFHSVMGHMDYSMECVGFITTFQRGVEWAASANVTQAVPNDFPSKEQTSSRDWDK